MKDFVFGSLATIEKRVMQIRESLRGVQHLHRLEPRVPQNGQTALATVTVGVDQMIERVECHLSLPSTAVIPLQLIRIEWDLLNWRYFQVWQATLPPQAEHTLVRYTIWAYPRSGDPIPADGGDVFSYFVGNPAPPQWAKEAIVYQIFPDRFHPGNGRSWNTVSRLSDIYGGTIRGIIDQLDYIAAIGFNCIWINPFFPDETHHGYHATDYFTVNPRLGTLEDMRELIAKAHAKGIHLLLDFVANHWGGGHPTFQSALADRESEYYHWYHWQEWPTDYKTFFGVKELPQINVGNPAVREHLFNSVRYWLNDVGFDGLRLDYVLGPSHDFWTELRAVVKQVKPDAWLFGEAVDTPVTQLSYEGRFDGCLDFVLAQALRDAFAFDRLDVVTFDAFLNQHEAFFPAHFSRPSFLDNHDMDRFLFITGNDKRKLKVAALCQFTLMGPPIVYNGTEVGVQQEHGMADDESQGMEECRQPMLWGGAQDKELLAYYTQLAQFRRQHPVLVYGKRETVHLSRENNTYAYTRSDGQETVLVLLNLGKAEQIFVVNGRSYTLPAWSGEFHLL